MKRQKYSLNIFWAVLLIISTLIAGCGSDKVNNSEGMTNSDTNIETESKDDSVMDTESEDASDRNEQGTENDYVPESQEKPESEEPGEHTQGTTQDNTSQNPDIGNDSEIKIEEDSSAEENIPTTDPYVGMTATEFYANYKPATSLADALYRSKHGFLSGSLEVPGQYAKEASYRPMEDGKYIRNTSTYYLDDGNTYVVVDGYGKEVMRLYKGGAYITLEEVAAYMYAFGGSSDNLPANYTSNKKTKPANSIWGEYLRLNHSYFTGSTTKYPYEPELPNITGCGGDLQYYEMDLGTTGTETPGYAPHPYNTGTKITRGAARIVYTRQDLNRNGIYEQNEVYVFYTHNHYNDFREYLNYYGGWGEMFGNVTGGGEYSSKSNCNPTPYVPTGYEEFIKSREIVSIEAWISKEQELIYKYGLSA